MECRRPEPGASGSSHRHTTNDGAGGALHAHDKKPSTRSSQVVHGIQILVPTGPHRSRISHTGMITRRFLAVESPLLPALAAALIEQADPAGSIDLRSTAVVLPTARSGRRFRALLLESAGDRILFPPQVRTPGSLLEQCLPPHRAVAPDIAVSLAWQRTLLLADTEVCGELAGHDGDISERERMSLAQRLQRLSRQLAVSMATPADIAATIAAEHLPMSTSLWLSIDSMQRSMVKQLTAVGLDDPDLARAQAFSRNKLFIDGLQQVWVVAAAPAPRERALLEALDAGGVKVTSIVHGDEAELADAFDAIGAVYTSWWADFDFNLSGIGVHTCGSALDQAAVVLEQLAAWGEANPHDITLVAPDAAVVPVLQRACEAEHVHVHVPEGLQASESRVGSLLVALHACVTDDTVMAWGMLLRHPDIERLAPPDALSRWDALWSEHLPHAMKDAAEAARTGLQPLLEPVRHVLQPLLDGSEAPACDWAAPVARVLQQLLGRQRDGRIQDEAVLASVQVQLQALYELPPDTLPVSAAAVLSSLIMSIDDMALSSQQHPDAIDCVGWLDAHLDDAPMCIITGLNQGVLPDVPAADPWMPETLRGMIGLPTAASRAARDTWLMHAIAHSGRTVHLIMPRSDAEGTPLLPSRLLLGAKGKALAKQAVSLLEDVGHLPTLASRATATADECTFDPKPIPDGEPLITSVSVTSFRSWLESRWGFLVQRDRRIKATPLELRSDLDHMGFGTFMHKALDIWGSKEATAGMPTTSAATIEVELLEALEEASIKRFGTRPMPGVRLQKEIAAHRLRQFAHVQAEEANKGWAVRHAELSFGFEDGDQTPPLLPSDGGLPLTGRIDRVDEHPELGWRALDYKTAVHPKSPKSMHFGRKGWKDLQLPLYSVLLETIGISVPGTRLGYIYLSPDRNAKPLMMAKWTADELADARSKAEEIVGSIQRGELLDDVRRELDT